MKKFIKHIIIFGCIVLGIYMLLAATINPKYKPTNDYLAILALKNERLYRVSSPKVMFIGGSNLAFGMDTPKLEQAFGRPVVNMGTHAALGMEFMLKEAIPGINPGDIVIVSPEYLLSLDGDYEIKELASLLFPTSSEYFDFQLIPAISAHLNRTRKNLARNFNGDTDLGKQSPYTLKSFNEYGDFTAHWNQDPPEQLKKEWPLSYRKWRGISLLNEYNNTFKETGACMYFIFPAYAESEYRKNEKVINYLYKDIVESLKVDIIGKPIDGVLPDSLFYDTVYHLGKDGVQQRMQTIIELMEDRSLLDCEVRK